MHVCVCFFFLLLFSPFVDVVRISLSWPTNTYIYICCLCLCVVRFVLPSMHFDFDVGITLSVLVICTICFVTACILSLMKKSSCLRCVTWLVGVIW